MRTPTAVNKHVEVTRDYDVAGAATVGIGEWPAGAKKDYFESSSHTGLLRQVATGCIGGEQFAADEDSEGVHGRWRVDASWREQFVHLETGMDAHQEVG